jgi:hypothetical protein
MAKAEVTAGICGNTTYIEATPNGNGPFNISLKIESSCEAVQKLAAEVPEVDALAECLGRGLEGAQPVLLDIARRCLSHPSCPVPVGIIKAVEVAAGLALPKDVEIKISKE